MEYLTDFKITFYSNSTKRTSEKIFNLEDYETVSSMLKDVQTLIKTIKEDGVLEAF